MIRPKAAPAKWPYLEHRTMAEVIKREAHCKMMTDRMRQKRLLMRSELG